MKNQTAEYNTEELISENKIGVFTLLGIKVLTCKDIVCCQGVGESCLFHLTTGEKILSSHHFNFYSDKLVEWNFIPVQDLNLVNFDHFEKIAKFGLSLRRNQ